MTKTIVGEIIGTEAEVDGVVLFSNISGNKQENTETTGEEQFSTVTPLIRKRGPITQAFVVKVKYEPAGKVYFTFSYNSNKELVELFVNISKPSSEINAAINSIAKLVSVALKHGAQVEEISKHLKDIDAGQYVPTKFPGRQKGKIIKSLPDLIGYALEFYGDWDKLLSILQSEENLQLEDSKTEKKPINKKNNHMTLSNTTDKSKQNIHNSSGTPCPVCGGRLIRADGCWSCPECGYSKCE